MDMDSNSFDERSSRLTHQKLSLFDSFTALWNTRISQLTLMATDIKISVFSRHPEADSSVGMNYFFNTSFLNFPD